MKEKSKIERIIENLDEKSPRSISGSKSITRAACIPDEVKKFIAEALSFDGVTASVDKSSAFVILTMPDSSERGVKTIKLSWEFIEDAKNTSGPPPSRREGFWNNASNILADFVVAMFDMWPIEPETRMYEMWRRFLVVRGFIDAFAPGNGDFDKEVTKAFIVYGAMGLAGQLQGAVLASMARPTVDDRKPTGVIMEAIVRKGDIITFDVKDVTMPRPIVRVISMKFIDSYREGGRILDLNVEPSPLD